MWKNVDHLDKISLPRLIQTARIKFSIWIIATRLPQFDPFVLITVEMRLKYK